MKLKAWYDVVKPRQDLRQGQPFDASEFAVRLGRVRLGAAPEDYQLPQRFFGRTFLTGNLTGLAAEVVRRLSGLATDSSAVFNTTTPMPMAGLSRQQVDDTRQALRELGLDDPLGEHR